ncbi:MAG: 4-(cytidine 5'-diphospho)-2-C-methyl-D-erythritol kinase [Ekhidna sp.]|nr:4-(cytidine 5'-diphospho)-2-C-methyl-D-erythritol kinase [Ekhidna sp.]MBC6410248.1 4-(cytidine 5'-diphospho)-2-C-methyl-D-erythritol kinase [Ekhidna sp.]MBC6425155.1 4-(cytidine 5'-diphospho)-2-C-methyl-D-erythritol kinase [Ekhidna sp.]
MISFPGAKINLGLKIVSKREDRYHNIESCFYPVPWRDSLEVLKAPSFAFKSYGLEIPGDPNTNLCVRAYHLLQKNFDIPPVEIHLLKQIPIGAGLGGGSADGAFTLKILNEYFVLELSNQALETYSLELGSDCPFFIRNQPVIAEGRGEIFSPVSLDLTGYYLAIYNPGIRIATKEAYAGVKPQPSEQSVKQIVSQPLEDWKDLLGNDFEPSIFKNYPTIAQLKNEMYKAGAIYAAMTGSGSTVYGLFANEPEGVDWRVFRL